MNIFWVPQVSFAFKDVEFPSIWPSISFDLKGIKMSIRFNQSFHLSNIHPSITLVSLSPYWMSIYLMSIAIGNDLLLTILSRLVVSVSFSFAGTYRYERSVKISLLSEPVESQPSLSIVSAKKRNFSDRKNLDPIDRFLLEDTVRAPILNNINISPTKCKRRARGREKKQEKINKEKDEEKETNRGQRRRRRVYDYVRTYAEERKQVWEERLLKSSASARGHREDSEPVARSDVSELRLQAGR